MAINRCHKKRKSDLEEVVFKNHRKKMGYWEAARYMVQIGDQRAH